MNRVNSTTHEESISGQPFSERRRIILSNLCNPWLSSCSLPCKLWSISCYLSRITRFGSDHQVPHGNFDRVQDKSDNKHGATCNQYQRPVPSSSMCPEFFSPSASCFYKAFMSPLRFPRYIWIPPSLFTSLSFLRCLRHLPSSLLFSQPSSLPPQPHLWLRFPDGASHLLATSTSLVSAISLLPTKHVPKCFRA
jgi:hypothetical protein